MRLMRLQSVVCRLGRRQSGYLQHLVGHPLRHPTRVVRADRPPTCEDRVHSLVSASPLRSLFAAPSGLLFRVGTTLPGFRPSPRHHRWCPLAREFPSSRYVPSSGFRNPSTVYSTIRICGLIASRCHAQGFFRSGISPDSQLLPARRRTVPPCRCRPSASPASRLPLPDSSASRLCSANRCVPPGRRLGLPSVAPLFGVSSSFRSSPSSASPVPRALRS